MAVWGTSWGSAWGEAWGPTGQEPPVEPPAQSPAAQVIGGGGYFLPPHRKKTKKQIREERERLGILPIESPEITPASTPEPVALLELSETKAPKSPNKIKLQVIEKGLREKHALQLVRLREQEEQDEEDLLALL